MTIAIGDYDIHQDPAWCPGCGNFSILVALKRALVACKLAPHQVLIVSGIGQGAKMPHYLKCNALNGLHGRTLPTATAAQLVNSELKVVAIGGDGDGYGEGGNHFLHTLRRNPDITYLVHDNQVYGLTKGQASPTSEQGMLTATTPDGAIRPFSPLALAIAAGGSFVARGFAGDVDHLASLMETALRHRGFSYVDILQPCVTFNKVNTYAWYRQRVFDVDSEMQHDKSDRDAAWRLAQMWGDRIPVGVIYQESRPTLGDSLPVLTGEPLVRRAIDPTAPAALLADFA